MNEVKEAQAGRKEKSDHEKRAENAMRRIVLATDDGNVPEWVLQEAETLNRAMWLMERKHAAKGCTGASKLAEMERRAVRCLPFGIQEVDEVLQGGAREGQVLELVGEPGSGKTQMCMMLTAMTATRGERVVYVDTNNSFSGERLVRLMQRIGLKQSVSVKSMGCIVLRVLCRLCNVLLLQFVGSALEKVTVFQTYDVQSMIRQLEVSLLEQQQQQQSKGKEGVSGPEAVKDYRPSLIVVDSIGSLLAPMLGGQGYDAGQSVLVATAMYLKALAERLGVAVVVTNFTVSGEQQVQGVGEYVVKKAALGDAWAGQAHARLNILRPRKDALEMSQEERQMRKAYLSSSTMGPSGACVPFSIY